MITALTADSKSGVQLKAQCAVVEWLQEEGHGFTCLEAQNDPQLMGMVARDSLKLMRKQSRKAQLSHGNLTRLEGIFGGVQASSSVICAERSRIRPKSRVLCGRESLFRVLPSDVEGEPYVRVEVSYRRLGSL